LATKFQISGKTIGAMRTGLGIAARGYAAFQAPDQDKARQSQLAASPFLN
jgi:hypothetical protein